MTACLGLRPAALGASALIAVAQRVLIRLRLEVEFQLLRSTAVEDMTGVFHVLGVAVGDHQILTGSQVFLIFEEVLPGNRSPYETASHPAPSGARGTHRRLRAGARCRASPCDTAASCGADRCAAAPCGRPTTPFVSCSTRRMCSRSTSSSVRTWAGPPGAGRCGASAPHASCRTGPGDRMTARSMPCCLLRVTCLRGSVRAILRVPNSGAIGVVRRKASQIISFTSAAAPRRMTAPACS
jgi:hypothetical protein